MTVALGPDLTALPAPWTPWEAPLGPGIGPYRSAGPWKLQRTTLDSEDHD